MTTFELPGCVNMWTVKSDQEKEEEPVEEKEREEKDKKEIKEGEDQKEEEDEEIHEQQTKRDGQHDYLILSRSDSTMVQ